MRKVYIVTQGEYSEYGIRAVFLSKKRAERFCGICRMASSLYGDEVIIEEWTDGEITWVQDIAPGHAPYQIGFEPSGQLVPEHSYVDPNIGKVGDVIFRRYHKPNGCYLVYVIAADMDSAVKIAKDYWAKHRAQEEGI